MMDAYEAVRLLERIQEWGKTRAEWQSSLLAVDVARFVADARREEARFGL